MSEKTLFTKIIEGEIPGDFVYRDEEVVAFKDINPAAPTHILIVPVKPVESVKALEASDLELAGKLLLTAKKIAADLDISDYRLVINNGSGAGQSVFHLHVHLLAGRAFSWPPG
jgi:histidine triad (HIT) family protein